MRVRRRGVDLILGFKDQVGREQIANDRCWYSDSYCMEKDRRTEKKTSFFLLHLFLNTLTIFLGPYVCVVP